LLPPWINSPGPQFSVENGKIRIPALRVKGLSTRTSDRIYSERDRGEFASLADFWTRVQPLPEEMELLIRAGAFDLFGKPRTAQYWEFRSLHYRGGYDPHHARSTGVGLPRQLWLLPQRLERPPALSLSEPNRLQKLQWEDELLGFAVSGHPLELHPDIAWETYCPVNQLDQFIGREVVTCGLIVEQRIFHQITGELMKFITIADRTGIAETELFAKTYRSFGLNTVRYRVLEVTAVVEPFESGRGWTLRVVRAGKPRLRANQGQ
jgi:DNA polymerase-3 subunit alpha